MKEIDIILQIQKDLAILYEHVVKIQDNQIKLWETIIKKKKE